MEKLIKSKRSIAQVSLLTAGALLGWTALLLQFYLIILNRRLDVFQTIIQYFSFFTILTNLLVASCLTVLVFNKQGKWRDLFSQPKTCTALAVYITVVGLVYNFILRSLWDPNGAQQIADELLHLVNPILFVVYWLAFVPKADLKWKDTWNWLWYPLLYSVYTLIRGALTGLYPYPFVDVTTLGYPQVLINSFFLCVAFLLLSLGFVGIGKFISLRKN